MSVMEAPQAVVGTQRDDERREIIELLTSAYWLEIDTVLNYIAASIVDDGACGDELQAALTKGVEEKSEHAERVGRRIEELDGIAPGDLLTTDGECLQPPGRQRDAAAMIEAVLAAETSAIRQYTKIVQVTAEVDRATNAMATEILSDERRHLRLFQQHLRA